MIKEQKTDERYALLRTQKMIQTYLKLITLSKVISTVMGNLLQLRESNIEKIRLRCL